MVYACVPLHPRLSAQNKVYNVTHHSSVLTQSDASWDKIGTRQNGKGLFSLLDVRNDFAKEGEGVCSGRDERVRLIRDEE